MHFDIYYDWRTKVKLKHPDNVNFNVLKVFNVDEKLILLNSKNELYFGMIEKGELKLQLIKDGIRDLDYNYPIFYLVDVEGTVFKTILEQIKDTENYRKIQFPNNEKIDQIVANNDGIIFITRKNNELMGMGNFGNVLKSEEPKKIECFNNMKILQAAKGDNFMVVLVQQTPFAVQGDFMADFIEGEESSSEELVRKVLRRGKSILKTEVWSFGSVNRGLLGVSDHIKRTESNLIVGLAHQSVYKIFCGNSHALALSMDGRLHLWGDNTHSQIALDPKISDLSAPTELRQDNNVVRNILDTCAGNNSTVILLNNLNFRILKKPAQSASEDNESIKADDSFENNLKYECENQENLNSNRIPFVLSHNKVLVVNRKNISLLLLNYFTDEQKIVRGLTEIYHKYIKSIMKYYANAQQLTDTFIIIFNITIVNLKMCFEFMENNKELQLENVFINRHFDFVMQEFHKYLKNLCDFKSLWTYDHFAKSFDRKITKTVFEKIFGCLQIYEKLLDLIYDTKLYENVHENLEIEELKCNIVEKKKVINDFLKVTVPNQLKEADETYKFWQLFSDSNVKNELHHKERRFVLDSQQISLKLLERTNLFASNRFVLFNDYLVCMLNKTEFIPINLVWLTAYNATGKNSFKITTPENQYKVFSLTPHDKNEWQCKLKSCVWSSLKASPSTTLNLPIARYGRYKFHEKNVKYPNYEVIQGKWMDGKFYDLCEVKIPPNRIFQCRITRPGEMTGSGIVKEDEIYYEGQFLNSKLHGFGSWENRLLGNNYLGYFKQDKFHGFGRLEEKNGLYVGNFVNSNKFDYGVYDEFITGNKYMGMYHDNKKHGIGIYITMDGSYFEGTFVNNNLVGEGLAIFPNGIYYMGELSLNGPNGSGTMYMPESEIIEEIIELDDSKLKMKGTILKGNLGGTWDNVSINGGQMQMNQIFIKTPSSSNFAKIKPEKKWSPLFDNWLESVFNNTSLEALSQKLTIQERWHLIMVSISRKRRYLIDLSENFEVKPIIIDYSCDSMLNNSTNSFTSTSTVFTRSNSEINLKGYNSNNNTLFNDMDTVSLKSFNDLSLNDSDSVLNSSILSLKSTRDINFIPTFINSDLSSSQLVELKEYVKESIENDFHPFHDLIKSIRNSFILAYGNWKCKPTSILSNSAMEEWNSIVRKIYSILVFLFPGLPNEDDDDSSGFESDGETSENKIISPLNFLHPLLLNDDIYSSLFLLYASKSCKQDEIYRRRLDSCSKKTKEELRSFLKIDSDLIPILESNDFEQAIKHLQQITEKYCPSEMLDLIKQTFALIDDCAAKVLPNKQNILNADNLLALTIYLIIKANIPHLGAELSLLEDLMDVDMEKLINSHCGYCYTTVKISYLHVISGQFFQN